MLTELLATPRWRSRVNEPYGKSQWTALMTSAWHGKWRCVSKLLQVPQMQVNKRNAYDMTALHMAAMNNRAQVVRKLLAAPGVDVNLVDKDGTALGER